MGIPLVDLKTQYARIKPEIDAAIREVVESAWFVGGPQVDAFEKEFAAYCQADHGVGVSSGPSALHLALIAAGVGPGDEVCLPTHTFIATSEVVRRCGAAIRLTEVDPETCTMDRASLERAWTPKVKAVVPVHLYGHPADMDPILEFASSRGARVIEDAAQAHGALYRGRRAGGLAPLAAFSFYPGKNLGAYGDGGFLTCASAEEADRMRRLSNHGRLDKYQHGEEGYNYRLDALQAAVLRVKLRHLDEWNEARRRAAHWYDERLAGHSSVRPIRPAPWAVPVYHLYVVRVPERDRLLAALKEEGIDAGIHYPVPLHLQPAYRHLGHTQGDFPVSEQICREILSLPIYPEINEEQVDRVAGALLRSL
jgi:dTDP-4-amino-4,6-dideoxygalactose transaminase